MVALGEPVFKTQKQLGSRAIVCDTFDKQVYEHDHGTSQYPGYGWYGHREGYNVLYGDWSAKWYGDPNGNYIWWPIQDWAGSGWWQAVGMGNNMITEFEDFASGYGVFQKGWDTTPPLAGPPEGPVRAWHLFDVHAGVDVGVDE